MQERLRVGMIWRQIQFDTKGRELKKYYLRLTLKDDEENDVDIPISKNKFRELVISYRIAKDPVYSTTGLTFYDLRPELLDNGEVDNLPF